jgi:hypothetical protein
MIQPFCSAPKSVVKLYIIEESDGECKGQLGARVRCGWKEEREEEEFEQDAVAGRGKPRPYKVAVG